MSRSSQMNPQLISFGGAKGGVGRSVICTLTGLSLAQQGKRVVLIDLDLGSANLHTLLGIMQPKKSLEQWILNQEESLEAVCSHTDQANLLLISGAASIFNPSDFAPSQFERLLKESLSLEVDYVLVDLGAGIHPHTLDIFNIAGRNFMITTPEPTSIQNTYAFLKAALIRRAEVTLRDHPWLKKILKRTALTKGSARITSLGEMLDMLRELDIEVNRQLKAQLMSLRASLIINRAIGDDETQVTNTLKGIAEKLLRFPLEHSLTLPEDKGIQNAIRKLTPFHKLDQNLPLKRVIDAWVSEWLLTQPYAPLQEECLTMIGTPSFLSQNTIDNSPTGQYPAAQSPLFPKHDPHHTGLTSHLPTPVTPVFSSGHTASMLTANLPFSLEENSPIPEQFTPLATESLAITPPPSNIHEFSQADLPSINEDHEVYDSQAGAYVEPEPFHVVTMEDPPPHEVTSIEEEVKTSLGWFHLKTSDLAPFRAAIQTSIYVDGHREVLYEDSYEGIYQGGGQGTQIEKRVERIHHESIKQLQQGGIPYWWSIIEERHNGR